MLRTLLLFCALLILGGMQPTLAGPGKYARAKAKGHMFTHRPVYKHYKGHRTHHSKISKLVQKKFSSARMR